MSALKIAFVCQWFAPEPISQPGWIANALMRLGAEVEVVTGVPNYPHGQVHAGYRAWRPSMESLDGVTIQRTPLIPSHSGSSLGRILNYVSWAASSALFGQRMLKRADVCLVYSSPATAAFAAMVARRRHRVPYVLLVQDVWPDSIFSSGFLNGRGARLVRRLVNKFVERSYREAAHIVAISPGMVELLHARGVPMTKLSVAYNWVDDAETPDPEPVGLRQQLGISGDSFVLMYAGNHGAAQALDHTVRAFQLFESHEDFHLVMVGDGMEKARLRETAAEGGGNVHMVDSQPRARMASFMREANAQLVSLADNDLFAVTVPSKLQAALASGSPVLAVAPGVVGEIVKQARAGVAVRPGDPGAVASAVRQLSRCGRLGLEEMGRNGRAFYEAEMSESVGANRLLAVLAAAVADEQGPQETQFDNGSAA